MIEENFITTTIYRITDSEPEPITIDQRFKNVTIVIQPLNLPEFPLLLPASLVTEENSVITGATGNVTVMAQPPKSFQKYNMANNVFDLAVPQLLSVDVPIHKLFPTFAGLNGCTHVAISVIGHNYG